MRNKTKGHFRKRPTVATRHSPQAITAAGINSPPSGGHHCAGCSQLPSSPSHRVRGARKKATFLQAWRAPAPAPLPTTTWWRLAAVETAATPARTRRCSRGGSTCTAPPSPNPWYGFSSVKDQLPSILCLCLWCSNFVCRLIWSHSGRVCKF